MNITEQDLMVGDWVQYGDIHPIKTRVLGINSVDKGKPCVWLGLIKK